MKKLSLQQSQQPGKLNLKNFAIVNDAIARMNVNDVGGGMSQSTSTGDAVHGQRQQHQSPVTNHSTFAPSSTIAAFNAGLTTGGLEDPSDDDDGEAEYAQVQEIYPGADGGGGVGQEHMYTFSQDTTPNKANKIRPPPRNRIVGGAATMDKQQLGGSKWCLVFINFSFFNHSESLF